MDLTNKSLSFFFVGIAGSGMSAIAKYLTGKGFSVSGSDRQFTSENSEIREKLEKLSIKTFLNNGEGISENISYVVVSSAIEESNPDLQKAKALSIPVLHRSEMLSVIVRNSKTIAISGTSGKSTVTAMVYHILEYAGFSPSLITGAGLVSLEKRGEIGNAVSGNGEWLVIEADESDGTLVRYFPEIGIILNIDKDHKEINELKDIFKTFSENVLNRGKILLANGDNANAACYVKDRKFLFGTDNSFAVQGVDFKALGTTISFRLRYGGELVKFEIPLPGYHNMENALAAAACAVHAGVSLRTCAEALKTFPGIFRRHQILGTFHGITLVDDFAHNPAKIAASIQSVFPFTAGKVFAWFQPHGFTPTKFLRHELVKAIKESLRREDSICFSEIYYAGGTVAKDISANDLAEDLKALGVNACYIKDRNEALEKIVHEAKPGDTILLMGARDPKLSQFACHVQDLLEKKS